MFLKEFMVFIVLGALVGCGSHLGDAQAGLDPTQNSTFSDNGPDFKTKDGTPIMDWVKKPSVRKEICSVVGQQKAAGYKHFDPQTTAAVARAFTLHATEAEIVILYSVEFECPGLG